MLSGDVIGFTDIFFDLEEVVLRPIVDLVLDTNQLPLAMQGREPKIVGLLDRKEQVPRGKRLAALDLRPHVPAIKGLLVSRRDSS